jgi:RNA polymerase sigma-70 factor (ECF subfamily)
VRAAEAARTSYGRLLALLAAADGDVPAAEDALADAFERALTRWPIDGVPDNPDAWLLAVARNRRRDRWRSAAERTSTSLVPDRDGAVHVDNIDPDAIPDRRLALMLVCAHPAINAAIHTPLMLNTVLGFTAEQIARAFSMPTSTLAARLVRAKRRIKAARIPFDIPDRAALPSRMQAVLEAVYGTFAIDWHSGGTRARESLTAEALHLADTLAELAPEDAEAHGLAALISLSNARLPARFDIDGGLVPLPDQDTTLWDEQLIDRGVAHLRAAHALGVVGRFQLEAAIQSVHCARRITGRTDWGTIRDLYRTLYDLAPSLGAAVALAAVTAEVEGPGSALSLLDDIVEPTGHFQPAWTTRAHLLVQLDRVDDAIVAFDKAISLTTDPAERAHLQMRRARLG